MKAAILTVTIATALVLGVVWADTGKPSSIRMPWREAGLTEKEAAAHLLNRFAFGPRPGEVDAVARMGLERWFERQLAGGLPDGEMEDRLRRLPALRMSTAEIFETYPPPGLVLYEAKEAGILPDDATRKDVRSKDKEGKDREALRSKVMAFAQERGYRPQKELLGQLMVQKLVRAVESENQLGEVMADFWFNHFNVSSTDNKARPFLLPYERDAIRPHAMGRFRDLLGATAKSPAMLVYLDNAQSSAAPEAPTTLSRRRPAAPARPRGVNENYARELMELHTLGVNGGYSQQDVVEVARAFTGWTLLPPGKAREMAERRLARVERAGGLGFPSGFQREGEFLFRADLHDAGEKAVLGTRLPAGRGIEDGEAVLDLLAAHRATARHLAGKLAVRFVSDNPPPALVDRLADVYLKTGGDGGDIRRLLVALVESPEFWSRSSVGAKIKSPFELAASALRASGGEIGDPREILKWIARMGQPLYAYQAPTGYPDRAETWVNTGSLLNRMSFGLQLAAGRVRGIDLDWAALNGGREPESREEALRLYAGLLLPGRDLASTLKLLGPMVADPNLAKKVDQAAPKETARSTKGDPEEEMVYGGGSELGTRSIRIRDRLEDAPKEPIDRKPPTPLEQVVGVILGSPEFQRR